MRSFILAILLVACTAHAEDTEFSALWHQNLGFVLEYYIDFDDKTLADAQLDTYIDGVIAGILGTYNYQAGVSLELSTCIEEKGYTPTMIRKSLLGSGQDEMWKDTSLVTFIYAYVHLSCAEVLGEYETSDDEEGVES